MNKVLLLTVLIALSTQTASALSLHEAKTKADAAGDAVLALPGKLVGIGAVLTDATLKTPAKAVKHVAKLNVEGAKDSAQKAQAHLVQFVH